MNQPDAILTLFEVGRALLSPTDFTAFWAWFITQCPPADEADLLPFGPTPPQI